MPDGEELTREGCLDASSLTANLGFLVRLAQQAMYEAILQRAGRHGITPARYSLLCLLRDNEAPSMAALAASLRIKPSNLAVLVQDMQEDGLLHRHRDTGDRRRTLVALTPRGADVLRMIGPEIEAMEAAFAERLGPDLHATVRRGLMRVAAPAG